MNLRHLATLLCLLSSSAFSQSYLQVAGRVLDSETKQPLQYANITIKGRAIGAVSNSQGGFEFNVPSQHRSDTLVISFIGYLSFTKRLSDIAYDEKLEIVLKPAATELLNLVISNKPYTVHTLLQEAIENFDKNYATTPIEMEGFYRETRKADKKYGYLLEAAVTLYKESYRERYAASLREVRINAYSKQFDYETNENFLRTLLLNDYIADPFSGFYKRYSKKNDYIMEDTTLVDNTPVFVVSSGKLPDWKETYWIDARSLAILKFDGESYYGADSAQEMIKPSKGKVMRYRRLKVINVYSHVNGRYYLSYLRMVLEHDIQDVSSKKSEIYNILERELMINQVTTDGVKEPEQTMDRISLETQLKKYNPDFWKTYNILTRTPLQEQIIKDLENESKLEEQFEKQKAVKKGKKSG